VIPLVYGYKGWLLKTTFYKNGSHASSIKNELGCVLNLFINTQHHIIVKEIASTFVAEAPLSSSNPVERNPSANYQE
jgi:hypothetical protein